MQASFNSSPTSFSVFTTCPTVNQCLRTRCGVGSHSVGLQENNSSPFQKCCLLTMTSHKHQARDWHSVFLTFKSTEDYVRNVNSRFCNAEIASAKVRLFNLLDTSYIIIYFVICNIYIQYIHYVIW